MSINVLIVGMHATVLAHFDSSFMALELLCMPGCKKKLCKKLDIFIS
jgi:hypothetical protein